jgi:hypothetical protein
MHDKFCYTGGITRSEGEVMQKDRRGGNVRREESYHIYILFVWGLLIWGLVKYMF